MTWAHFIYFAVASVLLYVAGAAVAFTPLRKNRSISILLCTLGMLVFASFIAGLWISLDRPPFKTLGETRLWYSFFVMFAGLFTYAKWKYDWVLSFSAMLSAVFIIINCLKPQIHDQTLMPALQSAWFIPHVSVYMFSYAMLGAAFILALWAMFRPQEKLLQDADRLVYVGLAFLTFGMLTGAVWAKQAWGHYWNWDPKETWAALTWLLNLLYLHLRLFVKPLNNKKIRLLGTLIIIAFACLQMCWWGVNLLPSAQDSVHVYAK